MKRSLLLLGILCLSSCAGIPQKPNIFICANNVAAGQVPCVNNQTNEVKILDVIETDKYIMFSPDDWGKILFYIRKYTGGFKAEAAAFTQKRRYRSPTTIVKRELRKVLKADDILSRQ